MKSAVRTQHLNSPTVQTTQFSMTAEPILKVLVHLHVRPLIQSLVKGTSVFNRDDLIPCAVVGLNAAGQLVGKVQSGACQ